MKLFVTSKYYVFGISSSFVSNDFKESGSSIIQIIGSHFLIKDETMFISKNFIINQPKINIFYSFLQKHGQKSPKSYYIPQNHAKKHFYLFGSDLFPLNILSQKMFELKCLGESFPLTIEQAAFISSYIFSSFCSQTRVKLFLGSDFEMEYRDGLIRDLKLIFKLFRKPGLIIDWHYDQIGAVLQNDNYGEDGSEFYFKSTFLSGIDHEKLASFNTLEVKFGQIAYKVNGPLFGCICLNSVPYLTSGRPMNLEIPKKLDSDFTAFQHLLIDVINLFEGKAINLENYDSSVIKSICISLGILHFIPFFEDKYDDEILGLLSKIFYLLPSDYFLKNQFSESQLNKILSSESLHLIDENQLVLFILNFNLNFIKYVHPLAIDSSILSFFVLSLNFNDIDFNFFIIMTSWFSEGFFLSFKQFALPDAEFLILHMEEIKTLSKFEQQNQQISRDIQEIDETNNSEYHLFVVFGMEFIRKEKVSPKDWENAAFYFSLAANENDIEAYWRYGFCLYFGRGTKQNIDEGKKLIQIATGKQIHDAMWLSFLIFGLPREKFEKLLKAKYAGALWQESLYCTDLEKQNHLKREAANSGEFIFAYKFLEILNSIENPTSQQLDDISCFSEICQHYYWRDITFFEKSIAWN